MRIKKGDVVFLHGEIDERVNIINIVGDVVEYKFYGDFYSEFINIKVAQALFKPVPLSKYLRYFAKRYLMNL